MATIVSYMSGVHTLCDEQFTNAENLAAKGKWTELTAAFQEFVKNTEQHFRNEEEILFPAFEQSVPTGPTQVMRMEHEQMRELIKNISPYVKEQNQSEFLGEAETLLILMQQHNMKEEQILYPMIDRMLGDKVASIIETMEQG